MMSLAAAAVAAVAFLVLQSAPASATTFQLRAPSGGRASGQAVAHQTADGWSIQLTVRGLKDLGPDRFRECQYVGPGSRQGQTDLITAGTFTVGPAGSADMQMWSAADPHKFPIMQVIAEGPGDAGLPILTGTPRR
jgi:hypothetical protein